MDSSISDLCKLLNALAKSSLTIIWPGAKVIIIIIMLMFVMVQAIKNELTSVQPSLVECRQTAEQLSALCGSPSDVCVQKYMSDLDTALSDIEEGVDDRELELNRMLHKAQQCTTCFDVRSSVLPCHVTN